MTPTRPGPVTGESALLRLSAPTHRRHVHSAGGRRQLVTAVAVVIGLATIGMLGAARRFDGAPAVA